MRRDIDIPAQLVAIHAALVEKLEAQPKMPITMIIHSDGRRTIPFYDIDNYNRIHVAVGHTAQDCIADAFAFIANMPDPENRHLHRHMKMIADVIDHGRENNIPEEYVAPLRDVKSAMTENLLTKVAPNT